MNVGSFFLTKGADFGNRASRLAFEDADGFAVAQFDDHGIATGNGVREFGGVGNVLTFIDQLGGSQGDEGVIYGIFDNGSDFVLGNAVVGSIIAFQCDQFGLVLSCIDVCIVGRCVGSGGALSFASFDFDDTSVVEDDLKVGGDALVNGCGVGDGATFFNRLRGCHDDIEGVAVEIEFRHVYGLESGIEKDVWRFDMNASRIAVGKDNAALVNDRSFGLDVDCSVFGKDGGVVAGFVDHDAVVIQDVVGCVVLVDDDEVISFPNYDVCIGSTGVVNRDRVHFGLKFTDNAIGFEGKLNVEIGALAEEGEKYYYEPEFFADVTYRDTNTPNNAQQTLTRAGLDNYFEHRADLSLGVKGNLLHGTEWRLEYLQTENANSVIDTLRDFPREYETQIKATLRQPLLKGFGKDNTLADYRIAKIDNTIVQGVYKEQLIDVVAFTIREYAKLYGAQVLVASLEEAVERLQESTNLVEQRFQQGDIAESDLFEIKSRLLERKIELKSIQNSLANIQNQILRLANNPDMVENSDDIVAIDTPESELPELGNLEAHFDFSKSNRALFEGTRLRIDQAQIALRKQVNGAKPELNLVGSVWHSNLDDDWITGRALNDDFSSWLVGVEYRMPMFGDMKAKSQVAQARRRLQQAKHQLMTLEREMLIDLREKLKERDTSAKQLIDMEETYEFKKQLLQGDFTRFNAGDLSIDKLIENEDDATTYYRKVVNKLIETKINQANLDKTSGYILPKYKVNTTLPSRAEIIKEEDKMDAPFVNIDVDPEPVIEEAVEEVQEVEHSRWKVKRAKTIKEKKVAEEVVEEVEEISEEEAPPPAKTRRFIRGPNRNRGN